MCFVTSDNEKSNGKTQLKVLIDYIKKRTIK